MIFSLAVVALLAGDPASAVEATAVPDTMPPPITTGYATGRMTAALAMNTALAATKPLPTPGAGTPGAPSPAPSLDFDLLEAPPPTVGAPDAGAMRTRRTMLTLHQGLGFALSALMATSVITGQLNYNDRFNGPSTGRYERLHKYVTFTTIGTFAATGLLAAFAPSPLIVEDRGFDRVRMHEVGMLGATAGMIAEGTLGLLTVRNEGRTAQASLARTHLVIGYVTWAFMMAAVSALVF
jgi:hypothetical protein